MLLVSSIDRCLVEEEVDPLLVVVGKIDPAIGGTQPLTDLQRAWRVNRDTGKLDEISLRGITCEYSSHGP